MFIPAHILVHIPYLAEVERLGSFTAAAQQLHITQAAVSYQIRQLEEKTGNLLVQRQSGGKTLLTSAGKALVTEYNQCAKRLRLTLDSLNFRNGAGTIRITTPIDFGSLVMPKVIAYLAEQMPNIKVLCHTSDEVADLANSDWDMAITTASTTEQKGKIIYHCPLRVVASPRYLAQKGQPKTLSGLKDHSLLLRLQSQNSSWRRLLADAEVELFSESNCHKFDNTFALLEAAKNGLGLSILPRFCVD